LLGDDVSPALSDVTGTSIRANNNYSDVDSSVSDVQPTVDNVVMRGVNNNYHDTASRHSELYSCFNCVNLVLADC